MAFFANSLRVGRFGESARRHSWIAIAGLAALGLAPTTAARAFSEPKSYFDEASNGGGGGRWFTGSPAEGYGCSVCHTGAPTQRAYPLRSENFPNEGYLPGHAYDLRLSWPEFAATDQQVRATMSDQHTSMGLIAEFVAESGIGSGVVEIDRSNPIPAELCLSPPNGASSRIYRVVPGAEPEEVPRCEANGVGERCILTVRACGAQEFRMRWTAPAQSNDTIWFAAGFVSTDRLSGNPAGDSVSEVTGPLRPLGAHPAVYEPQVEGGCSVSASVGGQTTWRFTAAFTLLLVAGWRIHRGQKQCIEPLSARSDGHATR